MPRRQVKRGGRKFQPEKPLIYVFCEGESEQAYAKFLKEHFADVAVLKIPSKTGLFSKAKNDFDKEPKYRNYAEVTDEIWFFFDVEADDCGKWDERWKIIETLRGLREKPNVHVRLLMTTACIEYWLMLHYKMMIPTSLTTVEDKERMRHQLIEIVPNYQKGDETAIRKIAAEYPKAVERGGRLLAALLDDGLPSLDDTDERNRWLCQCGKTFTTVQEAIVFLESLRQ